MKLEWLYGTGPATTQELADEIEHEGLLSTVFFVRTGHPTVRCLWGVIDDMSRVNDVLIRDRELDKSTLETELPSSEDNDAFVGTPKEHCAEMVRRIRAIP